MTVDVNLFVMTPDIVKPILSHPAMTAWVPQYHDTAAETSGRGVTFNQNLIAMKAKTWKDITGLREYLKATPLKSHSKVMTAIFPA